MNSEGLRSPDPALPNPLWEVSEGHSQPLPEPTAMAALQALRWSRLGCEDEEEEEGCRDGRCSDQSPWPG